MPAFNADCIKSVRVDDPYSSRTQLPLDRGDVCLMLGRGYPFTIIVISEDAQNYDPRTLWHGTSNSAQYAGTCIAADAGVITLVADPLACSMAWSCAGQD
jgi:hypothetical protein